ncbi:MAG: UDP-N-acetylmuramate--L-alanine ligase [Anaerolineales bacterium]|nr:UDP-N-acetylmuramate--L-alanine ligase [Anaerolineae bacterium]PWB51644.1 MAG: UDP-N-acetylmuramate--L-alanine ligase [Anaerolineales bacterium]
MTERKSVHFIGIGGTGLSAIARVLLESGYLVTGSDRAMSPMAKSLQADGVRIEIGHRAENLTGAQIVVRSSAVPDDNVEVIEAQKLGIPVVKRSEFLSGLMEGRFGIAVAGTHGKTTTTAMIAWMLTYLGQDPTFIVGGILTNTGTNAHAGKGQVFVIEADEYDHMFLGLRPKLAVITNIEHDHPDCYPTEADFFTAFDQFAGQIGHDGTLLVCMNDRGASRLGELARQRGQRVFSYRMRDTKNGEVNHPADYIAQSPVLNQMGGMSFTVMCTLDNQPFEMAQPVNLRLPGKHNVQNALAALAIAHQLQLPLDNASKALSEFKGTSRRFDVRGNIGGIVIIDDYAHHPTEIRATIAAARVRYPHKKMWVVWQPHTYSRTRLLFNDFVNAFEQADHVIVTDIYAAREKQPEDGFSSRQVVAAMTYPDARHISGFLPASEYLVNHLEAGDILLVLSAGDADQISVKVQELLKERSGKHE